MLISSLRSRAGLDAITIIDTGDYLLLTGISWLPIAWETVHAGLDTGVWRQFPDSAAATDTATDNAKLTH